MIERFTCPNVVGIDTGGTFTDFFFVDSDGTIRVHKRASCPQDPGRPVLEGLGAMQSDTIYSVIHGTTVATNALLERKGARVALISTAGFEDVIEIGRQNRPDLYAIHPRKSAPLVPARLRFGVRERILHNGQILEHLNTEEVCALLTRIRDLGVEAIAVCLLHSYVNPVHEEMIGELAREIRLPASLSCQVLREFREYERSTTVTVNASLRPVMEGYLTGLADGIPAGRLSIMNSAGGTLSAGIVALLPVHTILSGPAGGVIAATHVAQRAGLDRIITFDMGGTSTDVSLCDGGLPMASGRTVAGHPVRVPAIDIHTVGAGGGSIAFRDSGGSLKVGPRSAGADPGPVCYGKGSALTVTDANLFLGRMETSFFLGGRMKLEEGRIRRPMEDLARSLRLDPLETAQGIVTVANAVMERAVRVVSVERGHDPRAFTLVSFGGSGALHAVELARSLGIPKVLVPLHAGAFSAMGMAVAAPARDFSRTVLARCGVISPEELNALIDEMVGAGVEELMREGATENHIQILATLDMRYAGQSHEVRVPLCGDPEAAFHSAHERLFGFRRAESPVEIVTARARLALATGCTHGSSPWKSTGSPRPLGRKTIIYGGKELACELYNRESLPAGTAIEGPALLLEPTATTLLPPAALAVVDSEGNIIIECRHFFVDSNPG